MRKASEILDSGEAMSEYAARLNGAVRRQDGIAVAKELSITHSDISSLAYATNAVMADREIKSRLSETIWGDIAVIHWRVAVQVAQKQDLIEAYSEQNALLVCVAKTCLHV